MSESLLDLSCKYTFYPDKSIENVLMLQPTKLIKKTFSDISEFILLKQTGNQVVV